MSQAPLQLLISLGGGAYSHGFQTAAFGQSVAMQCATTSGLTAVRYEIYDYAPGFNQPAGWLVDANGVFYFAPGNVTTTPPAFTLPAAGANNWGFWMLRVRGNSNPLKLNADGSPNVYWNPNLTDESSCFTILSPNLGQQGIGFNLTTQVDILRGWDGPLMQSLRAIDALVGGLTGNQPWLNLTHATSGTVLTTANRNVTLSTLSGACIAIFPTTPADGQPYTFRDPPTVPATNTGCNWQNTPGQVQGNTGQYVEDPAAPGTFHAAGIAVNMPQSKGATQDYRWQAASSAWLCV